METGTLHERSGGASRLRLALAATGVVVALVLLGGGAQAMRAGKIRFATTSMTAKTTRAQKIYFFSDPATPINAQNPLVIRPHGFLLFQDGQWVLEKLHWSGWGSRVAHASGTSNSSNDIPNAASGARIKTPAQVTLSRPGRFQGHEVYRCFRVTVPPPASYPFVCLKHTGSLYILG